MVQGLRPGVRVIELGAGTGTVTRAILDAGVRPEDLLIIEKNAEFSRFLSRRFPGVAVANADALELGRHLGHLSGPADFVISGLPLVLFSAAERMRLLSQALAALAPDGVFHQFSYIGRFPIGRAQLGAVGAESSLMGFAAFNIPPAFVYRLCRSAAPQASRESRLDALTGGLRLDTPAG
jgi:phospholipid N-methyltransferase